MSDDHNRGAYTPQSEAPLAFDARQARASGERPMPITLIVSGVVLVLLVIGGVVLLLRGSRDAPAQPAAEQTIDAMKTVPPANGVPEAKRVDQQGLQIGYTEGQPLPEPAPAPPAATAGQPNFTTAPEAPGVRPPPGPPAPAPTTVNAPLPSQPAVQPPVTAPAAKAQLTPPPQPKTASAEPKTAPAAKSTLGAKTASAGNSDLETKLAAARAPAPGPKASASPTVQIGAFSSEKLAEQSWNGVASRVPGRIAGKTLRVEQATVDGKTYHRALVGGFSSTADADSFCAALKAQGGDCSVRH